MLDPRFALAVSLAIATALPASASVVLTVAGEARQEVTSPQFLDRYQALAGYLGASLGTDVRLVIGHDSTREVQKLRAGMHQVVVGPAHIIGAAMRYGYEPVARFAGEESAVFVASKRSGITTFEGAQGKRLALPPTDSLGTYLARGEFNAKGIVAKQFFSEIKEYRYHEVALLALEIGQADVAVADPKLASEWIAKHGGVILLKSRPTPGIGIAVNAKLDRSLKDRVRASFLSPSARAASAAKLSPALDLAGVKPIAAEDYKYVSTLGYFTPRLLEGAAIVTAAQVSELMAKGAILYDTRTAEEYGSRHIRGAKLLSYVEKSRKEVDFDAKLDSFDVSQLPQDKNAPIILACNGAECWKSYKSCLVAIKSGHKQVYWFRGGFPEWNIAGQPTDSASAVAQKK